MPFHRAQRTDKNMLEQTKYIIDWRRWNNYICNRNRKWNKYNTTKTNGFWWSKSLSNCYVSRSHHYVNYIQNTRSTLQEHIFT